MKHPLKSKTAVGTGLGIFAIAASLSVRGFNNDSHPDFVWQNLTTGSNKVWNLYGTGLTSENTNIPATPGWRLVGAGDFDRDSQLDWVWFSPSDGQLAVWYMNGSTAVGTGLFPTVPANWVPVAVGYFSGYPDSCPDIALRNDSDGQNAIWHMNNTNLVAGTTLPSVSPPYWKICGAADMDRDGVSDLLWRNEDPNVNPGQNAIWYIRDGDYYGSATVQSAELSWDLVGSVDFYGDKQPEWLWRSKTWRRKRGRLW